MVIKDMRNKDQIKTYCQTNVGETFYWNDDIYIKLLQDCKAVNLKTFSIVTFHADALVKPVFSEIHLVD